MEMALQEVCEGYFGSPLLEGSKRKQGWQREKLSYEVVSLQTSVDPTGSSKAGEDLSACLKLKYFYCHVNQSLDVDWP